MTTPTIQGKDEIFLGRCKDDNKPIYLSKPTFDCGWYWSFGYLGNRNCHYHLSGYQKKNGLGEHRNIDMVAALQGDYELCSRIDAKIWQFCEQAQTIYAIKKASEVFYRGGSHCTTNPMAETIKATVSADTLNNELLPTLLQKFWDDFGGNGDEKALSYIKEI